MDKIRSHHFGPVSQVVRNGFRPSTVGVRVLVGVAYSCLVPISFSGGWHRSAR